MERKRENSRGSISSTSFSTEHHLKNTSKECLKEKIYNKAQLMA
jgi:hypothetical protein